jgi:hypothetical protein
MDKIINTVLYEEKAGDLGAYSVYLKNICINVIIKLLWNKFKFDWWY